MIWGLDLKVYGWRLVGRNCPNPWCYIRCVYCISLYTSCILYISGSMEVSGIGWLCLGRNKLFDKQAQRFPCGREVCVCMCVGPQKGSLIGIICWRTCLCSSVFDFQCILQKNFWEFGCWVIDISTCPSPQGPSSNPIFFNKVWVGLKVKKFSLYIALVSFSLVFFLFLIR